MDTKTGPANNADEWSFENGVWRQVGHDDKYQVPIRHFSCRAYGLYANTSTSNTLEIGPLPPLETTIHGKAKIMPKLYPPSISLMADQSVSTKELDLQIRSINPEDLGERKKVPLFERIEFLSQDGLPMQTAELGYIGLDLDIGLDETWYLALYVTPDLFDAILNSLRLGRVHEMTVGISFSDLFVKHAHVPLAFDVDWFLAPGKTCARGWLDEISWRETAIPASEQFDRPNERECRETTSESPDSSKADQNFESLRASVEKANKSLTRALWVIAAAIGLSLYLR